MISTYTDLLAAIADWLNRADLTNVIPSFVQLAEAGFNRELRVRDMQVRSEAQSSLEFVPLPPDFLQQYSMALNYVGQSPQPPLAYISKRDADRIKASQAIYSGVPIRYYTIIDNAFELIPAPTSNVDLIMVYYAQIPALGNTDLGPPLQTNWLLAKSPDLYLASALIHAAPYLNDTARLQTWAQLRSAIMDNMMLESDRAMRSSTQLTARAAAL